jgi:hypothetical protein
MKLHAFWLTSCQVEYKSTLPVGLEAALPFFVSQHVHLHHQRSQLALPDPSNNRHNLDPKSSAAAEETHLQPKKTSTPEVPGPEQPTASLDAAGPAED